MEFLRGSLQPLASAAIDAVGAVEEAQYQAARESQIRQALERDIVLASEMSFPDGFAETTGGPRSRRMRYLGSTVPLTHGARQLVSALTRITSLSIEDFRRTAIAVQPISDNDPVVLTVRPARW
jgi:hypothetical protein